MNKRILELAIKAREYAESKPDIYQVAYDKKFAELLIRECTNIVLHYTDVDEGVTVAKKHFGVEE